MIVQRITVPYKPGKRDEAIALMKKYCQMLVDDGIFRSVPRFYVSDDPNKSIAYCEFEDVDDMNASWEKANTRPYFVEFGNLYDPLVDSDIDKTLEAMTFENETLA